MPISEINTLYLPFMRDLTYQTSNYINGQLLETQLGIIMPAIAQTVPISKFFYADNLDVTESELGLMQNFYQKYYMQKFRFKCPNELQKTLSVIEIPNGIINQFTLNNDNQNLLYFVQSGKIYNNSQRIFNVTLNSNLQVLFTVPPITGSIITAIIECDYAVMFDYQYGLHIINDTKTNTYKISFRLVSV